jgi:preprotein translocase subunit SecD
MQNRYPLWKNILLVVLLIIGLIYGAPNLYGDDPSVQISATGTAILNTLTLEEAKKALDEHKLKYTKVEQTAENLLFRFSDTDTQLQARDVIKIQLPLI